MFIGLFFNKNNQFFESTNQCHSLSLVAPHTWRRCSVSDSALRMCSLSVKETVLFENSILLYI